ncbi:hypothetical protein Q5P01_004389 [Channa striata]|uniref:NEDD8 ultimate buster 1 ubiquitin-like domain-containing protein n=1 Tax=Channa striata TaxID=64152 RepID=A0AA88T287_CHASR|nr:hypothetical protein Q5P01_004389 [Channa striata]
MENKMSQESNTVTLELMLPKDVKKDPKTKTCIRTRLDVSGQELVDRIRMEYGLEYITLILRGKKLSADQRLDEQGVKNHSFQILSDRDGRDSMAVPYLEIADQKGNPLEIPDRERKALILAMGYHEKGRSLMKRKQYDNAVCHLLEADQQFRKFNSALLTSVDNYAVLQLDIVWCYQALEALSCLEDAKSRLQRAEDCFLKCYGEQQERLQMIKGNTGREQVLFLRLYLLQSLLFYYERNDAQARDKLSKVESLYGRLCLDSEKMTQLMALGFTEGEARLGLRACQETCTRPQSTSTLADKSESS